MDLPPEKKAYWRQFDTTLASALKCARIEARVHGHRGNVDDETYLDTVLWLLDGETFERWQGIQQQVAEEQGAGPQRKLQDYA